MPKVGYKEINMLHTPSLTNDILSLPPGVYRTSEVAAALGTKLTAKYDSPKVVTPLLRKLSQTDKRVRLVTQGQGRGNESSYEIKGASATTITVHKNRKLAAKQLVEARLKSGLTQKELGMKVGGITQPIVSQYELNRRAFSQEYFDKVMKITGVTKSEARLAPVEIKSEIQEIKAVELYPEKPKKIKDETFATTHVSNQLKILMNNQATLSYDIASVKQMLEAMLNALGLKIMMTSEGNLIIQDPAK